MEFANNQMDSNPGAASARLPEQPGGAAVFFSGFVLPCASLSFYRRAVRKGTGFAILFFVIFMGIAAALTTAGLARGLLSATTGIRDAFAEGRVPEITISGGLASVRGAQPMVIYQQAGILVAVDTTGALTTIDPRVYESGFLLTRTELVVLNRGEVQRLPLTQLNELFQRDPLVINAETTARFWQGFSAWFSLLALLGLLLWDVVVRLLYLAVVALPVFGIVSLFRRAPYGGVLSVGVYAFVPALIADYLLERFGVSFFLMQTLILLVFWGVGMYAVLVANGWDLLGPDRPLRGWRTWLGLPLLAALALDVILRWPNGSLIDLITAAVTGIVLVGAGMLSLPKRDEEETPPPATNA